jgi:2-dehydro-3-deoxygluconokinase
MSKKKVLCFGELLLRISPALSISGSANQPMQVYVGGAEANVATALAGWNVPVKYCTVLPDNFMSKHVRHYLEYNNIFTSSILLAGNRIGVYYLEQGSDLKGSVIYDREHSAFSEVKRGMIDWDKVLHDVSWFNFSAISPALNDNVADVCLEAVEAASRKNITISVDLNYRSRLWKYGKEPVEVMPGLVEYCDVVMGNIWAANTLLGTLIDDEIHEKGGKQAYLDHAEETSKEIVQKFPKCNVVANTFRFDKKELLYYTTMYKENQQYTSTEYTTKRVVDRSGSGDCFMAGLIYGLYNDHAPQDIVNYASAAAFGKLQEEGDATGHDILTVARIETENKEAES